VAYKRLLSVVGQINDVTGMLANVRLCSAIAIVNDILKLTDTFAIFDKYDKVLSHP
jgi:hypothetical protein